MWLKILCFVSVGLAATEHAWKNGNQYQYEIRGRTIAGLHQVENQFAGVVIKGKLQVQPKSDDTINIQVQQLQQADIHANLSDGWSTYLHDHELNYKPLPISEKPFELQFKNGVIDKMYVDKNLPTWEVNILKAFASQFQVDTQGENLKPSKMNQVPTEDQQPIGVYKTIEDTVTGECETIYDVSPLPEYVLQSQPELAPLQHLKGEGQFIDIVKTKNYSNCEQRMAYHFGLTGLTDWEPASNQMGSFLSRSTISRVIISGGLKNYVIQSSVTTNKIVLAPHLYNNQKGIVASRLNFTLEKVAQSSGSPQPVPTPRTIDNLVYEYNAATQEENAQNHHMHRHLKQGDQGMDSSSSSSSSSQENSSSSSSSSEEHQQNISGQNIMNRARRSMKQNIEKRQTGSSSSSSSESDSSSSSSSTSSSEESFWQTRPQLNKAPNAPFMPYFVGYQGNSILASKDINGPDAVYELAQQIGEETYHQYGLASENTLSKFNILVDVIHTMDEGQLQQATQKLYFAYSQASQKSEQDSVKYQAWSTYRDAVAQVGTGPALLAIKQWIKEGKIAGEEAAEVVGVLADTARYPTTEYMDAFFELVKSEEVQQQWHLNTSALISFTDLVRRAQVNKDIAHNRYPVHSFGRLAPKYDRAVVEQYIPYLEQQLKKAVQQGDSPRIQTYIRALGNTAHPKILAVFEPYLEGQQQMSEFQRFTMVASLDKLIKVNASLARSVLFKIYQNSGEAPQVRVAAVMQLMKTNPPRQILQRMAQHTNYDHSRQVNAAVKSAIVNAANLEGSQNYELAQNAKSAVHLLTTIEFGAHESHNFIRDYIVEGQELEYQLYLSYVHGKDSFVPSSAWMSLWRTLGGYNEEPTQFSWATSGTGDLLELFADQFTYEGQSLKKHLRRGSHSLQGGEGSWSFEQIAKLLNLQQEEQQQVEGHVIFDMFGAKRQFAFDNHTVEQLPNYIKYAAQQLQNGYQFNVSKLYNQYSIQLGFPTATGLPFFYTLTTPTRVYLGGEISAKTSPEVHSQGGDKIQMPQTGKFQGEFEMAYSTKTEGILGFTTPYDQKAYLASLGKNWQFGVPVRASLNFDLARNKYQAKVQPLDKNRKQKVFEYSNVAYTSKFDILALTPVAEGRDAEQIHVRPVQRIETTVGERSTGFAFDVKAESEQRLMDWATIYKDYTFNAFETQDGVSAIIFGDYDDPIYNNNFTVIYNPQQSTAEYVELSLTYKNKQQEGGSGGRGNAQDNAAIPSSKAPQDEQRQNEFLERAGAGIKDNYAQVIDVAAQFEGQNKAEYVATVGYAWSPVDTKSRYLFYYGQKPAQSGGWSWSSPYQVAWQYETESPNVPLINYQKALSADPTIHISSKINMGENVNSGGEVKIQGKLEQTPERREYVQRHPLSKLCEQQMQEGNYVLPACRNATASANFLDHYQWTVNYQGVPDSFKQYIYQVYSYARYFGYQYVNETFFTPTQQGQVQIEVQFENDLTAANVSIETPALSTEFNNVDVYDWIRPIVVVHPEYEAYDRFGQDVFQAQQYPTCVVDKNQATTFDNRTYALNIGKCWHAMVQPYKRSSYENQQPAEYDEDDFGILVREGSSNQKELVILFGSDIVQVQPSGSSGIVGTVTVNGQKAEFSQESLAQYKKQNGEYFVQIYALPTGEVRLYAPQHGIEVIYYGSAVKLQASNYYRNQVRGLCGTFTGEYSTDFTTPKNCILKDTYEFAASYAIDDGTCEGPAKELHQKAQNSPCYWETVLLGDVVSDREAGRHETRRQHQSNSQRGGMNTMKNDDKCSKLRVKVVQQGGKTCFSLRPQPTCTPKCKATRKMEKKVDFHCVPNSAATKHWMDMINAGTNPDFSQKPANAWFKYNVPERCIPN
ncbi:hypothetical protein O3M35_002099 [Rhynocoris fuscipes]|uniref:Vitellogenin n=1 Tax=Rhynocoris fuscipes TaxID=488301 RepID=A0AAW1CTI1_9HEMI